jgi:gliding motility-associated-like protein
MTRVLKNIPLATKIKSVENAMLPNGDTCVRPFHNKYRSPSASDGVTKIIESSDHNIISVGYRRTESLDPRSQTEALIKFNMAGNILLKKQMAIPGSSIADVIKLKDSQLLVPALQNGKLLLNKMDSQLNTIWTKTFIFGNSNFKYSGVVQGADSSLYMLIEYNIPYSDFIALIKFSKNGDYLWQKNYTANNGSFYNSSLLELNGYIYFKTETAAGNYYPTQVIFKVNTIDGGIVWANYYNNLTLRLARSPAFLTYKNRLVLSGGVETEPPVYDAYPAVVFINEDGTVAKTKIFKSRAFGQSTFASTITTLNGDFIFELPANDYTVNPFIYSYAMMRADSNLQVKACNRYPFPNNNTGFLLETSDKSIFKGGANSSGPYSADIFLRKYSADLKSGNCYSSPLTLTDSSIDITATPISFNYAPDFIVTPVADQFLLEDYDVYLNEILCADAINCDAVKINGPQTICRLNDTATYNVIRNPECSAPVLFITDSLYGNIVYSNDSIVKVKFKRNGNTKLYAAIDAGCKVIGDSLAINISPSVDSLNLGPDKVMCGSAPILLNAHKGFKFYLWQDGSTDPTLEVTEPGTYYVKVTSFCNTVLQDTVIIAAGVSLPLFIGYDTAICRNDSMKLNANAGFVSYSWSPGYNIDNATGNNVTVWPSSDTSYSVRATQADGCVVSDTIKIAVYNIQPLTLGSDTSICAGTQLLLDAGAGFASYQWNTEAATEQISVSAAGFYNVTATDIRGCRSKDTIEIKSVFIPALIHLGNDTSLCSGKSLHLDAGNDFATYIWNTGAITNSIDVNSPGIFWVDVIDNHHCHSGDTINVLSVLPIMPINLGNDTSICQGEEAPLDAGPGFTSYQWNTGETTQKIYPSHQGLYFINARNNNNCISRDSLLIINVNVLPVVNLNKNSALCFGATRVLDAGPATSYLWQDASTSRTFTASGIGKYWVKVTNSNNCTASDTTEIKSVLPLPVDFITKDTAVCEGEKLILYSIKELYSSYLWSTGAASPFITIISPGQYWLQVTDVHGCTAKEYVNVSSKNCITSIFFPNAFTPNYDGLNDTYKPKLYGAILKYHLAIYNRFGQKVFETYDHNKGWDGSFNNNVQDTFIFTWYCEYQFKNETPKTQKGIVTLIR